VKFSLPPLYPIIDFDYNPHPLQFLVRELVREGITLVQIRDKKSPSGKFLKITQQTVELSQSEGLAVIVNDRTDIALLSGAHGVHLGQEDLPAAAARKLLGPDKIIGVSMSRLVRSIRQRARRIRTPW
jgi:thiamine-phosphate diphosphorylase